MKRLFFLLFMLALVNSIKAQNEEPVPDSILRKSGNVEATFPGGDQAWRQYLIHNLNAAVALENNIPLKRGVIRTFTVVIQFIIDTAGNISDFKPLTNHGYGMEKEVIRVIRKGPNWVPGMVNDRKVKAYRKQPVTFQVSSE